MSSITAGIIRCFSLASDIPDCSGQYFYQNSDKSFWDKPYTIIEKDGVKIGVIGLHGVFAFNDTVSAATRVGIEARDEVKWLQHYIDELNGKVDLTVALIHEGVPARQSSGEPMCVVRWIKIFRLRVR